MSRPRRPWVDRGRLGWRWLFVMVAASALRSAEPVPVMVQSAPGRFEVAAIDPSVAHAVAAVAEEGWQMLSAPLGLPAAFPSPIYLRVLPSTEIGTFQVTVEVGGLVSTRVRADAASLPVVRRAVVQSLLMRLAVAQHGATAQLSSPLWLEHACAGWWETRRDGAQLDALKVESRSLSPPPLDVLLNWRHGAPEPRSLAVAATWLLAFLQSESGREREWPEFLRRLLAGADPAASLALCFPDRFAGGEEREVWWQTGYHYARRARSVPGLDPAESRAQLGALVRWVVAGEAADRDRAVPLSEMMARASEPLVGAELTRRTAELDRLTGQLHPFYRNAGLSLRDALAGGKLVPAKRAALVEAFEQDWRAARELERATTEALDRLEHSLTGR